jgi:hypothetical protein
MTEDDGPQVEEGGYRGPDRRRRPTPALSKWSFFGGRRSRPGRRGDESVEAFVDVYPGWSWVMLTVFMVLNLLDAHYTLLYLQRGGQEANPVAVALLDQGMGVFIGVKAAGITLGAAVFCILNHFRNGRVGVVVALSFYQALFIYHLLLYFNVWGNVYS